MPRQKVILTEKNSPDSSMPPITENDASLKIEQHTLDIEEPDDIAEAEAEQKSMLDKAMGQFKDFFKYEESKTKTPKRKFFQKKVAWLSKLTMSMLNSMYPEWWQETYEVAGEEKCIAPKQSDYEKIYLPLARIADRHVNVVIDNPDYEDLGEAIINTAMLVWQMRANHKLLSMLLTQERRNNGTYNGNQTHNNASPYPGEVVVLDNLL